jgi:hypothetical protein
LIFAFNVDKLAEAMEDHTAAPDLLSVRCPGGVRFLANSVLLSTTISGSQEETQGITEVSQQLSEWA